MWKCDASHMIRLLRIKFCLRRMWEYEILERFVTIVTSVTIVTKGNTKYEIRNTKYERGIRR